MSDEERVQALLEYELLDTLPEKEFDDIVELASAFFRTPISLISLLDSHRQWFKARVGLAAKETPIELAFCYHAIQNPTKVFVVPDSFEDIRFKDNLLATGDPHVRFYAGAPLVTNDGFPLGTLCVIDNKPRSFSSEEERVLKILAEKVIERIDARKKAINNKRQIETANDKLELTLRRLLEAEQLAQIGNWSYDYGTRESYFSPEMYHLFGVSENDPTPFSMGKWLEMLHPDDKDKAKDFFQNITNDQFEMEYRIAKGDGEEVWLQSKGMSSVDAKGAMQLKGTVMNITNRKKAEQNKALYTMTLEEMLYALSHKIRRPVANVIGIVNELAKGTLAEEERKAYVPYLKTSAEELDVYIHELNDFIHRKKINITSDDQKA